MGTPVIRHLLLGVLAARWQFPLRRNPLRRSRIGTTQSLSGHYSEFGIEQLRGLQMWARM
jgi:hypothetical protein